MSGLEKRLFVRFWLGYFHWHLKIRLLPYKMWRKSLGTLALGDKVLDTSLARTIEIAEMAGRHHIFSINCLRRCIVQRCYLARHGVATSLHFGVKHTEHRLAAHCWLTHQNKLLNDGPEVVDQYVELADVDKVSKIL